MNYPVWEVPIIGGPWVIGIIAIFHVMISQFAVGGGLYLAIAERKAHKEGRPDWLPLIEKHSHFFLLITAIYGTVSGVGIWYASWLAPAFVLMPIAFGLYFFQIPASNKHLLELGMSTIGSGTFSQVTRSR